MGKGHGRLLAGVGAHTPNHVPLLSAQDVCSTNTLGILLRPILPEGRGPIAMVQSWISIEGRGVAGALKADKLTQEGHEAAARCVARARRAPGVPHDYHRHREGVWDDDKPHRVTREQSEVRIIITAHRAKCQTVGHNKCWMQQGGAAQQGTREGTEGEDHGWRAEASPNSQGTEELEGIAAEHTPSEIVREEKGKQGEGKREPRGEDRTSADTADSTDQETADTSDQETTNSTGQGTTNTTDKETDTWSAGDGHNPGTRALVPEKEREGGMGSAQAHLWAVQQTSAEGPRGGAVWPRTLDPYAVCRVHNSPSLGGAQGEVGVPV